MDADQQALKWANTGNAAQTRYQVRDAAFSSQDQAPLRLVASDGDVLEDTSLVGNAMFNDADDYTSPDIPDAGRKLTEFWLDIDVVEQAANNAYGMIRLSVQQAVNIPPVADFTLNTDGLTITVINKSHDEDGEVLSWAWDFGNGGTSNDATPTYSYSEGGELHSNIDRNRRSW